MSTLVYLFADQFAAHAPAGEKGVRSMSSSDVVSLPALGQMMYVVGFAHLHRAGLIRLQPATRTGTVDALRRKNRKEVEYQVVTVQVTGDLSTVGPQHQDLAAAIARHAQRATEESLVRGVVSSMLSKSPDPYWHVIWVALDNASRLGYVTGARTGWIWRTPLVKMVTPVVSRKHKAGPNSERIETLRPAAAAQRDEWMTFRSESPDLADALKRDVDAGILSTKQEVKEYEPSDDWD